MSKDDRELIERLRGLLVKATPVPWEAQGTQMEGEDRGVSIIGLRLDEAGEPMYTPTNGIVAAALLCPTEIDDNDYTRVEANAALLVAAVNALPTLLARLEALQAQPVGEAWTRVSVLVEALHDRLFGVAAHDDPALALKEIRDEGGIHEVAHELLRALPVRGHGVDDAPMQSIEALRVFRKGYREARYFFDPSVDARDATPEEDDAVRAFAAALTASPPVVEREAIAQAERREPDANRNPYRTKATTPVAQGDEVRDALEPHTHHLVGCRMRLRMGATECTCGLTAALATLTKGARDAG